MWKVREFIRQIDPSNLDTRIVLGTDREVRPRDLRPEHGWPELPVRR